MLPSPLLLSPSDAATCTDQQGNLFDYSNHGPSKCSATADFVFLLAAGLRKTGAVELWSMLWYDPSCLEHTRTTWRSSPVLRTPGLNAHELGGHRGVATEAVHYWYFSTASRAEMASFLTATGSSDNPVDSNRSFTLTSLYHKYKVGDQQLFDYGKHGPNKYRATATVIFLHPIAFQEPEGALV